MTIRKPYPHVNPVCCKPERVLQNLKAATADMKPINEAKIAALFSQACRVDDLCRDDRDALCEKAVNDHVEGETYNQGANGEELMQEIEWSNESGCSWQSHDDVRRFGRDALEEHEQRNQRSLIVDSCKIMVLSLFGKAYKWAKRNFCTRVFSVLEQSAVKVFFPGDADQLLDK